MIYDSKIAFKTYFALLGRFLSTFRLNGKSPNLSVAPNAFFGHFLLSLLISYDFDKIDSVSISTPKIRFLKRLYVQKSFPFVSRRWRVGRSYKIFFYGIYWIGKNVEYDMNVNLKENGEIVRVVRFYPSDVSKSQMTQAEGQALIKDVHQSLKTPVASRIDQLVPHFITLLARRKRNEVEQFYLALLFAAVRYNFLFTLNVVKNIRSQKSDPVCNSQLKEINDALYPMFVGPHGYSISLSALTDAELSATLNSIFDYFRDKGFPAFLNSGTLLGSVREGNLIAHDDDMDLGIFIEGNSLDQVAARWAALRTAMSMQFKVKMNGSFAAIYTDNGVQIDVFPAWSLDQKIYVYPYCYGEVDLADVLPLATSKLRGLDFPAPAKPEKLLEINYGPAWKTPDADWRFDWNSASRKFRLARSLMVFKGIDVK